MKRVSLIKILLSTVFASIVMFTVSVHEVHYLFAEHHIHEHCDNHLHAQDNHADCSICKFDVSLFVESFNQPEPANKVFDDNTIPGIISDVILNNPFPTISLRGPPTIA